ncbi:hypothetical protein ABGB18_21300 [Nonomuraea sp. B12E4]|uniref:hypothetical protein n=1 Tax=Nonomuraea sp. B12E4 TaxID=3153564 RepID=UPI00325C61BB
MVLRDTSGAISVAKFLSTHYDPIAGIVTGVTRALGERDPAQVTRMVHTGHQRGARTQRVRVASSSATWPARWNAWHRR